MDFSQRMLALGDAIGPLNAVNESSMCQNRTKKNPFDIGSWKSFVPILGEILWEVPIQSDAKPPPYYAYICRLIDGRQIGYVRVPEYKYNISDANAFEALMIRFENSTEAMVFDQIDNPGGSIFQMYALLSKMTDKDLDLQKHQISIYDELVETATAKVALADAGNSDPSNEDEKPDVIAFYRFVLSEYKAGRGITKPTEPIYLYGIDKIHSAIHHYSKKIIVLINELDFSAAEFCAAILQDNKRAKLFGVRTAGAGGCVRPMTDLDKYNFGIKCINITWTLAWRPNGKPIEELGVQPDIHYSITVSDLQSGFSGYRLALISSFNE
jgi:C-terminal processing protease CtpA/Prc